LRLPRELGAGRDRESSTWLPAIYPVREDGEGAGLRTLGKEPRRMGRSKVCWPLAGLWREVIAGLVSFRPVGGLLRGMDRSACRCVQSGLRRKMRVVL
jgi:hypothetical protein